MTATVLPNSGEIPGTTKETHPYRITEQWDNGRPVLYFAHYETGEGWMSGAINESVAKSQIDQVYQIRLFTRETTGFPDLFTAVEEYINQLLGNGNPDSPPTITDNSYQIDLTTNINIEIPDYVENRMRTILNSGGWSLISIQPTETGYRAIIDKQGSVTLTIAIIVGLVALLGWIGVLVKDWTAVKLSTNAIESKSIVSKTDAVNKIIESMNDGVIDSAEADDLINSINAVYSDWDSGNDNLSTTIGESVKWLVVGGIAIAGLQMLNKK